MSTKTPANENAKTSAAKAVAEMAEEEVAKRRQELKTLIKMGKMRGFLTHQEINDHLPETLAENEVLEAMVSMLDGMGIAVYERAPDAATLLIAGGASATEEEAEEAAESALWTVDPFGRTPDPVRMYRRAMGTVELPTREGEISIAADEMQISEVVNGVISDDAANDHIADEDFDEFDEETMTTVAVAATPELLEVEPLLEDLRSALTQLQNAEAKANAARVLWGR